MWHPCLVTRKKEWDIAAAANVAKRCSLHKDTTVIIGTVLVLHAVGERYREQKKLQRTGNIVWLVCAAILDCSQLLVIVVVEIALAMLATQC